MPLVEVFTTQRSAESKQALMEVICDGVSETFAVEKEFISIWLHEFPAENALLPAPMVTVIVHCFTGRTVEQKRALYTRLDKAVKELDPELTRCQVTVAESPLENWGIGNGVCAADVISRL